MCVDLGHLIRSEKKCVHDTETVIFHTLAMETNVIVVIVYIWD